MSLRAEVLSEGVLLDYPPPFPSQPKLENSLFIFYSTEINKYNVFSLVNTTKFGNDCHYVHILYEVRTLYICYFKFKLILGSPVSQVFIGTPTPAKVQVIHL